MNIGGWERATISRCISLVTIALGTCTPFSLKGIATRPNLVHYISEIKPHLRSDGRSPNRPFKRKRTIAMRQLQLCLILSLSLVLLSTASAQVRYESVAPMGPILPEKAQEVGVGLGVCR